MAKVIGVRFKSSGRIYYFDPADLAVEVGDGVIVETARGQEYGDVVQGATEVEDTMIVSPLKPVLRLATSEDAVQREKHSGKEQEAFEICRDKIAQHKLDMKLVRAEYSFNGAKLIFYFTADERVDFRDLVKDLASQFKTRIELRQIGVRDEAKMLGGLGSCGRPVCCKAFLDDFRPVSIKMAKEQSLSLSPTKISGLCGRLMCCLQYEQSGYEEMKKKMPRVNREVLTPDGVGYAIENNAITERTRVRLTLPDGTIDVRSDHYTEIAAPGDPIPARRIPEPKETEEPPVMPVIGGNIPFIPNVPTAAKAPAAADAAPAADGASPAAARPPRKRRRGGRGRGAGGEGGEAQPQSAQQSDGAQNAQRPRPQGQQRRPAGARAQGQGQATNPGMGQGQSAGESAGEGEKPTNPNRRRRRRGGSGRPKPEGGGEA